MQFARIFERQAGQVLAVLANMPEDGTPAVIISWRPSEAHELCHLNVLFDRSDQGATDAQRWFRMLTLERALSHIGQSMPSCDADGKAMPAVTHTAPKQIQ